LASGEDLQRLYRLVAFDRVLARLFRDGPAGPWILKGGCALEIRYHLAARTTVDLDLALPGTKGFGGSPAEVITKVWDRLSSDLERDLKDGFEVRVSTPTQEFTAPPKGGARYPVALRMGGKRFSNFHLDVGFGDVVVDRPDILSGEEFLSFAGIPPARVPVLPVAQQFAEKVHAYTLPRDGPHNTRVKDLVDLVIMLEKGPPDSTGVQRAVEMTFACRGTHAIPTLVPDPPMGWTRPYERMAEEVGLTSPSLDDGYRRVAEFWSRMDFASPSNEHRNPGTEPDERE